MQRLVSLIEQMPGPLAVLLATALVTNTSIACQLKQQQQLKHQQQQPRQQQKQPSPLKDLLVDWPTVDGALVKVLASNDDSGRNGVVVPAAAWSFFPELSAAGKTLTCRVPTVWDRNGRVHSELTIWRRGNRDTTRRLSSLGSPRLNQKPANAILILGRYKDRSRGYTAHVLYPGDRLYEPTRRWAGVDTQPIAKNAFALFRQLGPQTTANTPARVAFLKKFDVIKSKGFVTTLRSGSTGIGYTLETLLGLEENNDPTGDFQGMELKAYRDSEGALDDKEKMNLFLKEPKWLDGLNSADRIAAYGYVDKNGRTAMYSTVTVKENSHGFRFEPDEPHRRLFLVFKEKRVAYWDFATLQKRLTEKHTEAAFVAAKTRGKGKDEQFHYHTVTWCSRPSIEALLPLIRAREVMLELRMHIKENGAARNHGTAFRVHKNKLPELYAVTVRCR